MAASTGDTGDALTAASAALSARDVNLAETDAALITMLDSAHQAAVGYASRLDAVRAEIDAAVARGPVESAAIGRQFGAFLLAKNREIHEIVTEARAAAAAKTVALQSLADRYRGTAQP